MQALFRRLGRVLVGLLAGMYGGSELLGGLHTGSRSWRGGRPPHPPRHGRGRAGLTLPDPVTGEHAEFFCLPLGENPTAYDRYLVRARDVEPA